VTPIVRVHTDDIAALLPCNAAILVARLRKSLYFQQRHEQVFVLARFSGKRIVWVYQEYKIALKGAYQLGLLDPELDTIINT
jgi:hypothetical protein